MLDDAGLPRAEITAPNALDTHVVRLLLDEGAPIDNFGAGERLIASSSSSVLSGVYKLAEEKTNDQWIPKIKANDNRGKITLPGNKQVYRVYRQGDFRQAIADVITLVDEYTTTPLRVVNANSTVTHASQTLTNFSAKPLTQEYLGSNASPIKNDLFKAQQLSMDQVAELPEATKQLVNPDRYPVYLTATLAELQEQLITKAQSTKGH